MLRKELLLDVTARFHAHPATTLVAAAQKYESMICLATETQVADAKKIFSVMSLAVPSTGLLEIITDGSDELAAMSALEYILLNMDWR